MIYTTCRYAPVELFAGFHEETKRLDPTPQHFECSETCAHPNLCGFAKAVIEEVQAKGIQRIVLTDCCDAMRRTYDVLLARGDMEFVWLLSLPHKNGEPEIRLFEKELRALAKAYAEFSGKEFDAEAACAAYAKQQKEFQKRPEGKYLRIAGAHGGKALMEQVERVFGNRIPIVNDTCTGTRELIRPFGKPEDFFTWYAPSLLNQPQACMRMWYNGGRHPNDEENAQGTILHTIKFCDYYGFEYMEHREDQAMPLLKIETDTTRQSLGQLSTRLEAFREELGLEEENLHMEKKNGPVYVAGVDSGSASTDSVIMDRDRNILGRAVVRTGAGAASGAKKALEDALEDAGLKKEDLSAIVTTGYGRQTIGISDQSVTEITCHARGANYLDPDARTVIDIGGQDSKVIRIDENGKVLNFVMNDKCAAGTGRFLEMQARALEMSLEEMSKKGLEWKKDVTISSMCTVFAESEVVGLVAKNTAVEDIIHGLNMSVAGKTVSLVNRLGGAPGYIMTGGVAMNKGVVQCLEKKLGQDVFVSPDSQLCGSIGAALIGLDQIRPE